MNQDTANFNHNPAKLSARSVLIAAVVLGFFSTSVQAQPASNVYVHHGEYPAVAATANRASLAEIPVTGRANANQPASVTGAQRGTRRPTVVEAPVTGREWAERQGRAGISAGH